MNSTLLRTIAILMALGAAMTAWLGYRMSAQQSKPAMPTVQMAYPQLVATHDLLAGQILTGNDVRVDSLPQRDPSALTTAQQAVGKMTLVAIEKGSPVLASHFPVLSPVAQSLRPDERAVAIKVNEVVGVGGFVKPGDHVDVLLYLRREPETSDVSSAQVVLSNVRVLAYGDDTAMPAEAMDDKKNSQSSVLKQGMNKLESARARDGKSAILAVPEQDTSRLMLAENSGILKLALRGATLADIALPEAERHFVKLEAIGKTTPQPIVEASATAVPVNRKPTTRHPVENHVIVYQGDQMEIVKVKP